MAAKRRDAEPRVRIAPLGELRAYTISEYELDKLEQGTPISDLLTIGLCLLSAALTLLTTLLSAPLPQLPLLLFFCTLLIFGLGGAICTFLGWRLRTSTRDLAREIRARMPDAPAVLQVPPETPPPGQAVPPSF